MIVKYVIQKHKQLSKLNSKDIYVVWCEIQGEHHCGCKGVFQGTRQECRNYLDELKKGE